MGTVLDSSIFIGLERELSRLPSETAMTVVGIRLRRELGAHEEAAIAAITASELLHGVHRANAEFRGRREAFVEAVLVAFPPLAFDLLCARAHARIWATLQMAGTDVGPHDRLIAATAIANGWRVATSNVSHYAGIRGLDVINPDLSW